MADDQQGTSQAPITDWATAAAKYGGTVAPPSSTPPQVSGSDAAAPPVAKAVPDAAQKIVKTTQDMDWAQAAAKYGGTVAPDPQESSLHKLVLGPNTMLGQHVEENPDNVITGTKDLFSGNIKQGLSEIWGGHVTQGSRIEKLIQTIDPNFKGSLTPDKANTLENNAYSTIARPPIDAAQFIDRNKHPMAKALAELAQSAISPQTVATVMATGGAGMIDNPVALGMLNRLVSGGFSASTAGHAYKELKQFKEAYDAGKGSDAEYHLTLAIGSGALALLMGQHAATGEAPAANAWTKAGADADAAVGTGIKKVAGGLANAAADLIPDKEAATPPAEHLEQAADNLYKAIKPGKSMVADDFRKTLNDAMPQLSVVANKNPDVSTPVEMAKAIEDHRVGIEAQLKQKAFNMRGIPEASMSDLASEVQDALHEAWEKEGMRFNPDQREKGESIVMKQLGIESKMQKDPDTGETMPTPIRSGPVPDLYDADKIRGEFNRDISGSFGPGIKPSEEVFAKQIATNVIRDAIDKKFEELGVPGVKEWRKQETGLIDVRDALQNVADRSEKAGKWDAVKSLIDKKGWGSMPAMVGAVLGGAPGAILGELSHLGMDWWKDQQTNPNVLTSKAMESFQKAGVSADAAIPGKKVDIEQPPAIEEHIEREAEKKMLAHGEEEKGPKLPEDELREHYKDEVRDDMGLPTTDDLEKAKAESAETKTEAKPKITYDTDSLGIKWASQEGSPAKVSIPKNLEGAEADKYAQEKLDEQKAFAKSREPKPQVEVLGPVVPRSELDDITKQIFNVDSYDSLSKDEKGTIEDIAYSIKPRSISDNAPKTQINNQIDIPKLKEKVESEAQPEESPSNNSAAFGAAAGINALSGRKEEEPKTVVQHRWGPVTWAAHEKTPVDIGETLDKASKEFNVPALLTRAQAHQESRFDTNAVSNKGARGIMQLMPHTADALGVTDPHDPEQNIYGGVRYMSELHDKFGSWDKTLAAYNAGPTLVQKLIREHGENWFDYLPNETKRYVHKILVESVR